MGRIELEIGGAPGSNRGTVPVVLPDRRGEVTYTASFTINNTTPTDDATLNLENDSSVKLAVYRKAADADDYAAVSGAAGGTLYGALEVKVHEGSLVRSSKALVRFEETEKVNGTAHAADQSHVDVEVKFNEAAGWQKQSGAGAWDPSPEAPTSAPAKGGRYRYLLNWNTASAQSGVRLDGAGAMVSGKLLGHNGAHEVSLVAVDGAAGAKVAFVSAGGGAFDVAAPEKAKVEVANLVIKSVSTSNGTQDYFKFDPDSDDDALTHPTITFEIEDKGDKHRYQWYLWAKPTRSDELNSVAFTGIMLSDGSKTVTINAASPQGYMQEHPLTQWGTYTFDLRIKEIKANSEEGIGEPLVDLHSTKLEIPYNYTDANGEVKPGHSYDVRVNDDNGEMKAFASYYLESERDASTGEITFLDANMEAKDPVPMQLTAKMPREDVEIYTFDGEEKTSQTQQDATYRAIFSAVDNFADEYRDHKNKRAKSENWRNSWKSFHIEDDQMDRSGGSDPFLINTRSMNVRKAFAEARWQVLTPANSPKQVSPIASTVLPQGYFSNWTWAQVIQWSRNEPLDYFHYYEARDKPAAVTGHKYGRYIHAMAANTPPKDHSVVFGLTRSNERLSMMFVGQMRDTVGWTGYNHGLADVEAITIHELGHNLLPSGHKHGYGFPYKANAAETTDGGENWSIQPEEKNGYDQWANNSPEQRIIFRRYRASLKPGVRSDGPIGRDDYLRCVMEPLYYQGLTDWRFCVFHRNELNSYQWG